MDDLGYADLGCFGSSFYETPNLDRLAEQGLKLTDGYASCPVCSPTRASMLTGQYPARVGITNFIPGNSWGKLMGVPYFDRLPKASTTIAHAMKQGGYNTYHVGKWHLGPKGHWPQDFGFDVNVGGCDMGAPKHGYFSPYDIPNIDNGPEGEYLTDRLTDEANDLIVQHGPDGNSSDTPFFMYLSHYAVHTPIQAPQHLVEKYQQKARDLGLDQKDPIEVGEPFPTVHGRNGNVKRRRFQSHPTYAAMVENMDTNIGKTLDALDAAGLSDNTIVIFTSDNGGLSTSEGSPTCNAPLNEGKGWMYEGGVRESWLIRWPKVIKPGSVSGEPITSPDVFPTLLEAAGLPAMPDKHVDGKSFLPMLKGDTFERGPIFWHYPHYSNQGGGPSCSIRDGDYKLIEFFEDGRLELYNLREDIGEETDLASAMPEKRDELYTKLNQWKDEIGAAIPEPNQWYDDMVAGRMPTPNGSGLIPGDDRSITVVNPDA